MITIEIFFMLSALVVLIGLIVWRRDLKSGRILRPKTLARARSVRDLFANTRSPAMSPQAPDADAARRRTVDATKPPPANGGDGDAGRG
jgi:hypothetical protein